MKMVENVTGLLEHAIDAKFLTMFRRGEWQTYPEEGLISEATKDHIVESYAAAFSKTKLQMRNARQRMHGMGLHDDRCVQDFACSNDVSYKYISGLISR
jgi:hypothetical protein